MRQCTAEFDVNKTLLMIVFPSTHLLIWASCHHLHHALVIRVSCLHPFQGSLCQFLDDVTREHQCSTKDGRALFIQSKDELSNNAKVSTSTANTPEQLRIFLLIYCEYFSLGRNKGDLLQQVLSYRTAG